MSEPTRCVCPRQERDYFLEWRLHGGSWICSRCGGVQRLDQQVQIDRDFREAGCWTPDELVTKLHTK